MKCCLLVCFFYSVNKSMRYQTPRKKIIIEFRTHVYTRLCICNSVKSIYSTEINYLNRERKNNSEIRNLDDRSRFRFKTCLHLQCIIEQLKDQCYL